MGKVAWRLHGGDGWAEGVFAQQVEMTEKRLALRNIVVMGNEWAMAVGYVVAMSGGSLCKRRSGS